MKNKYKTTNYIFDPTPALSNISSLNDIEELANDIYSTNFGEAEIDYGTLRTLHNEASDIAEKAKELSYEVQNDLAVEFDKNFNLFVGLTLDNGLEVDFPFNTWAQTIDNIHYKSKLTVNLDVLNVLEGFNEIVLNEECDKNNFISNFSSYLSSNLDKKYRNRTYYEMLAFTLNNSNVDTIEVLKSSTISEITKALSGKKVDFTNIEQTNSSRLIESAAMLSILCQSNDKNFDETYRQLKKDTPVRNSLEGFTTHCENFANSNLWHEVKSSEKNLELFAKRISEITPWNHFFHVGTSFNLRNLSFNKVREGFLSTFFDKVLKEDIKTGNLILENLDKHIPSNIREQYLVEKENAQKILTYHELQSLSNKNTPAIRKSKI